MICLFKNHKWWVRAALLLVAALFQIRPAYAQLSCGVVYASNTNGEIYSTASNGLQTLVESVPVTPGSVNPFGISPDGVIAYFASVGSIQGTSGRVVSYNTATNTVIGTSQAPTLYLSGPSFNAGAVNPVNGWFYFGAANVNGSGATSWLLYALDPNDLSGTPIFVGSVTNTLHNNGDMVFDGEGNLYILSGNVGSAAPNTFIFRAGQVPTTPGTYGVTTFAATQLTTVTATTNFGGIAFNSAGELVVSTTGIIRRYNPINGQAMGSDVVPSVGAINDLAYCLSGNTIRVQKSVPAGRRAATDQFSLTLSGGGLAATQSVTTTGNANGIQTEELGPFLAVDGATFTINELTAGTTDFANYSRSWSCVDTANGNASIASGSSFPGTSITVPVSDSPTGSDIVCTIVNEHLIPDLTLTKSAATLTTDADSSGSITEGDTLSYTLTLTNTGDVPLTSVVINDPLLTPNTQNCGTVAVDGVCALTGTLVVSAAQAQAGEVVNTGSATSTEVPSTPSNTVTTPVVQIPALTLVKSVATLTTDADSSGGITRGDTLSYTLTLTNTGDVPLTTVVINDPLLTPNSQTCGTVAVGATCALTGTLVVSAAQAQAGQVVNTGSVTSTEVPNQPSNTVTTPVVQVPALTLVKSAATLTTDADSSGGITEGDTLSYTLTLTNTGDVPLTTVVINDPLLTPNSQTCGTVAIGGTCALTGTLVVSAAQAQAGQVVNTGSVTSTEVPNQPSNTITTPVVQVPALTLVKSAATLTADADSSGGITEGDTLSYTLTLTNTGDVPLTNVVINDPLLTPNSQTCGTVAVGATCALTGTLVVSAAQAQAGQVVNTGSVTSTEVPNEPSNTITTPVVQVPALTLVKSAATLTVDADSSGGITEGDTLSYTLTLTNTGDVPLTSVVINDPLLTPNSQTCGTVAVGATCALTGTLVVSAAQAQAGQVVNTGSVTSTEVPSTPSNQVTTPVVQVPALTLVKSAATLTTDADSSGGITEGDTLSYTLTLTNTGDVPLTTVVINDPLLTPSSQNCGTVAVGATCALTGTLVVSASQAQAGQVVNTGSVTSTEVPNEPSNTVTTPVVQVPALTLVKSAATLTTDADSSGGITEGDTLSYTLTLTNTGDVPLTSVVINDPLLTPSSQNCGTVAVGATCALTGTLIVSPAQAQAGQVVNTGSVTSTEVPSTPSNQVTTPVVQVPALTLVKSAATLTTDADSSGDITEGDTLSYTLTLTNTGDVPLTTVVINDPLLTPGSQTCGTVAVGATCALTGTLVVSASQAQAGQVVNTGSATSTEVPNTPSNQVTTPVVQVPALTLVKSAATLTTDADSSGDITEGDTLSYTLTLTNTGDVPLTTVVINDPLLTPSSQTCGTVAVGATCALTGTLVVSSVHAQAGQVVNTGSATSTEVPNEPSNTVITPVGQIPALTLVKSAATLTTDADSSGHITEGDTLSYTLTLTNTGDVPLTTVVINDPLLTPSSQNCGTVAVGATCALTGTLMVSASQAQAGQVVNTGFATSAEVPNEPSNTITTPVVQVPALTLVKGAATLTTDADSSGGITEGDTLSYTLTLTNIGDVPLTTVVINDPLLTPSSQACGTVAVGATCALTGTLVVSAAQAQAGQVVNTGSVTSTEVPNEPSNTITTPVVQVPALTLVKSAATLTVDADSSGGITEGDTLSYTLTLTNTGDVPLTNVVINDPLLTPNSQTCGTVAVGATCALTGTLVVSAAQAQAGNVVNTGSVTSTEVPNEPSNTITTPVVQVPDLTLVKSAATLTTDADSSGDITEGDTLSYTLTLTNTGDVPLTTVVINDPLLTPNSQTCGTVAVGATCVLTGTLVVSAAQAQAGNVVNTGSVTSTEVPNEPSNTVTTPVTQVPALTLVKSAATLTTDADSSGGITEGDTLSYTLTLTNAGDVPLTNVVINDPLLTPSSQNCGTVAVGGTCVLAGTLVVSSVHAQAGQVVNTGSATSTEVPNEPSNTITTPVVQVPALTLVKGAATLDTDADGSGSITSGDTLGYTLTLTNTGDVPLNNVVINDPLLTPGSQNCGTVAIGGTCALAGTLVVSPAQAQAGQVVNIGSVTTTEVPLTPSNQVTTPVVQIPGISLVKSEPTLVTDADGSGSITAGDTLSYTLTLTNTGDVPLNNVAVLDSLITPDAQTCATVAVGGTCVLTGTLVVSAAQAQSGQIANTGTASSDEVPPTTTNTVTTPVVQLPAATLVKSDPVLITDADASGTVSVGDTLSYTLTLANTGDLPLTNVTITDPLLTPAAHTCPMVAVGDTCVLTGTLVVSGLQAQAGQVVNTATATSDEVPETPSNTVTTPVERRNPPVTRPNSGTGEVGQPVTLDLLDNDTDPDDDIDPTSVDFDPVSVGGIGEDTDGDGDIDRVSVPGEGVWTVTNTGIATFTPAPGFSGQTTPIAYSLRDLAGLLSNASPINVTITGQGSLRIIKTATPYETRVGDIVRYTLTIENVGTVDVQDATLIDTPPAGFSYVDSSLAVADDNGAGRLAGTYPIRIDQVDVAAGGTATVSYMLRVGAGVINGVHINRVHALDDGRVVSNESTAEVRVVGDPLIEESLIIGTVFDDRDEDGWQDRADLTGIQARGGFSPQAYVANSTTVDRGEGPLPAADASAPLLHGLSLGELSGRRSQAVPATRHRIVISQHLREPVFTDDFVMTTEQGLTLRMNALGEVTTERQGEAAKGRTAAMPTLSRHVTQMTDGYRVDYVIGNAGIDEHGIPGVRIAAVEGLLIETDQYGRYHLTGIPGGSWERGRNFLLKIDPATLPPGSTVTTDNPLLRRITPGIPVRFDFGVKLPEGVVTPPAQLNEVELGEVLFGPGSVEVLAGSMPQIEQLADWVREHPGAELVIAADGETQVLALGRAEQVKALLARRLTAAALADLTISLRTDVLDPASRIAAVGSQYLLGTVLFDTDQWAIRPEFRPLIATMASRIAELGGGTIRITGHTDLRASVAYNQRLGMRRADAVQQAIKDQLPAQAAQQVRVVVETDPVAHGEVQP